MKQYTMSRYASYEHLMEDKLQDVTKALQELVNVVYKLEIPITHAQSVKDALDIALEHVSRPNAMEL